LSALPNFVQNQVREADKEAIRNDVLINSVII